MSFNAPSQDRIDRLRLHVPAGRMLQPPPELRALELHPSGLPRSAIVLLRRVRVARRGALGGTQAPPGSAWREAAQGAVNAALRNAVRPIAGTAAGPCDAVLFADMAELLACLARDWLDGTIAIRWWWRELFTHTPTLDSVCAAWLDNPPALAAARDLLRSEGRWDALIARWPARDSARLLELLVPALTSGTDSALDPQCGDPGTSATPPPATSANAGGAPARTATTVATPASATQPAVHVVAEMRPAVSAASGIDGIAPEPRLPAAHAAVHAGNDGRCIGAAAASGTAAPAASPSQPVPARDAPPEPAGPEAAAHDGGPAAPIASPLPSSGLVRHAPRDREPPAAPDIAPRADDSRTAVADSAIAAAPEPRSAPPVSPAFEPSSLHTDHGGLFYLLNVALHLDLYADFTQPRRAGLALSPWDLLAWIGLRWFGPPLQRDPLWAALAAWAGRDPADEIGAGFTAPPAWQVRADWLLPFERPQALTMRRVGDRFLLRHPAGFCVCDLDAASAASLPAWLAGMPALADVPIVECRPRQVRHAVASERSRWLAHLARYVRARCAIALQSGRRDVPALVARHAAQVIATPATLEVRLRLATLPLPIRFAGLDRDPGWIPAAGRSVRFVFD